MNLNILFEDQYMIVCEKPIGVPSQSDKTSDLDMVNILRNYIYDKSEKKEQPYVGVVHRLDRPVGGIMIFAKNPFAAKELSQQIQLGKMKKKYYAVATGDLSNKLESKCTLVDYIEKDGRTNLSKISNKNNKNAKRAELNFKVLEVIVDKSSDNFNDKEKKLSFIEVELLTGRHHQIRVQMSNAGAGLWGDTKYNKEFQGKEGWVNVALFAYQLSFYHPKTKKELVFEISPDKEPFVLFDKIK